MFGFGLAFCDGKTGNGLSCAIVVGDAGARRSLANNYQSTAKFDQKSGAHFLCISTSTYQAVSRLLGLVEVAVLYPHGPLDHLAGLAAGVGDTAGHSLGLGPVAVLDIAAAASAEAAAAAVAGSRCYTGRTHQLGHSDRRPIAHSDPGHSCSRRTAGHSADHSADRTVGRTAGCTVDRTQPAACPVVDLAGAGTAAGAGLAAGGSRRIAGIVAVGRPLAQSRLGLKKRPRALREASKVGLGTRNEGIHGLAS